MIVIDILGEEENLTTKIVKEENPYPPYTDLNELQLQLVKIHQEEDNTNHWLLYQHSILCP
jgi:hypothetical protein